MKRLISLSLFLAILGITFISYPYALPAIPPDMDNSTAHDAARPRTLPLTFNEEAKRHSGRSANRSNYQVLRDIGRGAVLIFLGTAAQNKEEDGYHRVLNHAGDIFIVSGLGMIVHGFEEVISKAFDTAFTLFNPPSKKLRAIKEEGKIRTYSSKDSREERYRRWERDIATLKYAISAVTILPTFYSYWENVGDNITQGLNPFALQYPPEISCTSYQAICMPLTTTVMLVAYGGAVFYNIKEAVQIFNDPKKVPGTVPGMGCFNGLAQIVLSKKIQRNFQYDLIQEYYSASNILQKVKIFPDHMDSLPFMATYFLRVYGHFQSFSSFFQIIRNSKGYIIAYKNRKDMPLIEIDLESQTDLTSFSQQKSSPQKDLSSFFEQEPFDGFFEDETVVKKEKTKRHGTPGQPKGQPEIPAQMEEARRTPESPQDKHRKAGLERVNDLRNTYPIKTNVIMKELRELCKFLPSGQIISTGNGSEFKLMWIPSENKPISLKFEIPHGSDSTVFRGNKLDCVLNTLELGYLHGWDPTAINAYIDEYRRENLLRLDQVILFILGNRPV